MADVASRVKGEVVRAANDGGVEWVNVVWAGGGGGHGARGEVGHEAVWTSGAFLRTERVHAVGGELQASGEDVIERGRHIGHLAGVNSRGRF